MPYNPKSLAGLTKAGKGRPKKHLKRCEITLSPELVEAIDKIAKRQRWKRNYTFEELLRHVLRMPSDRGDEMELIIDGAPIE